MNTTISGDEPGMSKEVKILSGKLCWPDGVGISHEADRKHVEAIIREKSSIQFDVFENPHVQREQGGSARRNLRRCG